MAWGVHFETQAQAKEMQQNADSLMRHELHPNEMLFQRKVHESEKTYYSDGNM